MPKETIKVDSVAEAYLMLLKDRGVDYLFGNAGTDFASIIEALSKSVAEGTPAPTPITVPHENLGVAMAHGYYLATGKPQAVMVHVNVGTANGICGVMNAARENIPILFTSGRTPLNEEGVRGARSIYIHWGQEMFDQAGVVREMVKWDYELRNASQLETVVDRAVNLSMSEPRGPIYLTLPREVLAEQPGEVTFDTPSRRQAAVAPAADPGAIDQAAALLAAAENPVIITSSYGRDPSTVDAFAAFTERHALPVIVYRPRYLCLPSDHPMHLGFEPAAAIKDADVIVVLDCDVPWIPSLHKIKPDAKVIHISVDPLFSDYPIRGFPADLVITGSSGGAVAMLDEAMSAHKSSRAEPRRVRIAERHGALRDAWDGQLQSVRNGGPTDAAWVAHCIDRVKGEDDILVSESQISISNMNFRTPGTFFGTTPSGGLGWGLGASLGVKLGAPDRRMFSVMGDGAYMFGNPTPGHYVAAANGLPVLTIILNNAMWGAVRKSTLGLHPDGAASRINRAPLTYLDPAPDYHKIVEASDGYGEEVKTPDDLPAALERALKEVDVNKRQALLNVHTHYSDDAALADAKR